MKKAFIVIALGAWCYLSWHTWGSAAVSLKGPFPAFESTAPHAIKVVWRVWNNDDDITLTNYTFDAQDARQLDQLSLLKNRALAILNDQATYRINAIKQSLSNNETTYSTLRCSNYGSIQDFYEMCNLETCLFAYETFPRLTPNPCQDRIESIHLETIFAREEAWRMNYLPSFLDTMFKEIIDKSNEGHEVVIYVLLSKKVDGIALSVLIDDESTHQVSCTTRP